MRLLRNKGNILFVTVMFTVVLVVTASLLPLLASVAIRNAETTEHLYDRYTLESYSKIACRQALQEIDTANASIQYSPLLTDTDLQIKLQTALNSVFLDSAGKWCYNPLLPSEIIITPVNFELQIINLIFEPVDTLESYTQIVCPSFTISITTDNTTYSALITDVYLTFSFSGNKLVCKYNTSNAVIANETFTIQS